jgi:hypothetical protein
MFRASRDLEALQREMGPALRLTPLSPACGPHRSGKLDARRFNAAPIGLLRTQPSCGVSSPGARAGAGSVGSWFGSRGPVPAPGGSETGLSTRASSGSTLPVGFAKPRLRAGSPACATLRLRGFSGSGSGLLRDGSRCSPRLVPRPRGISPSRRSVLVIPRSRRPCGPCPEGVTSRLDVWKMRGRSDSGKRARLHLSTFGSNASGQGWITQRLAASARFIPGRAAPAAAGAAR